MYKPGQAGVSNPGRDNLQLFAGKLRELRKRAGLTQQEFAEAAFCSPDHVTKMERGVRLPSTHMLRLMIQTFREHGIEQEALDQLEQLLLACKLNEPPPVLPAPLPLADQADEDWDITVQTSVLPLRAASLDVRNNPSVGRLTNPQAYTVMFGREKQIAELLVALQKPDNQPSPLIAITGLGGVGKSTLAYHVAELAVRQGLFDEYIWESAKVAQLHNGEIEAVEFPTAWAQFSPSLSFEGLLDSLAFTFRRADLLTGAVDLETKLDQVAEELAKKRYLMVVDNLESCHNPRLVMVYLSQLLRQTGTALIVTSRELPPAFDGYTLALGGLDNQAAVAMLRHEARARNLSDLLANETDPEVQEAFKTIVRESAAHPLALKQIMLQLGMYSLDRILADLKTGQQEKANLRHRPAGGLYSYIFKAIWNRLSRPSQKLLLKLSPANGALTESEVMDLYGATPNDRASLDHALAELVRFSLLEVSGVLQKRYRLHPLTANFLNSGLIEQWPVKS